MASGNRTDRINHGEQRQPEGQRYAEKTNLVSRQNGCPTQLAKTSTNVPRNSAIYLFMVFSIFTFSNRRIYYSARAAIRLC